MNADLYAWLDQAIIRREEIARAATPGPWTAELHRAEVGHEVHPVAEVDSDGTGGIDHAADAEFIAANGPAAVLRRCAADRKILELLAPDPDTEPENDEQLHARFAHPDFEYRTTTGQRKQWDDCGVPPYDDDGEPDTAWEPNTAAGIDGWERFDYTEECYWRRRLPPGQERQPCVDPVLRNLAEGYGWDGG